MKSLSEKEFMNKVINNIYMRQRLENKKFKSVDVHVIENNIKANGFRRKKK